MRTAVAAPPAEIERNWRLLRTWDALSHTIMQRRAPRTLEAVPAASGRPVDVQIADRDGAFALDPWPFEADRLVVNAEAQLLEGTFADEDSLERALAETPRIELSYELRRGE
jgi:hypothetical protein